MATLIACVLVVEFGTSHKIIFLADIKPGTHLSVLRSAPHQIGSLHQCGPHKWAEAFHCTGPIWSLSVHQKEHYFVRALCGQLFCHFCCFGGEQVYFMLSQVYICTRMECECEQRMQTRAEAECMVHTFVHCLAFAEAANRPYSNILYGNSLWYTDSRRIAFGCLPNIHRTAEYCLLHLVNISTSNIHIVFKCRIRVLFAFQCKPGFTLNKLFYGVYINISKNYNLL